MLHTQIYCSTTLQYNIDQALELTMMSVVCSIVILYAKYLAEMLRIVRCRKKMFWDRTEAMLFRPKQYQYPFRYYL